MQIEITGKKVVLKDSIPLSEGYDLLGLILEGTNKDMKTMVPIMMKVIESWEFDGDPNNKESYEQLDVLGVVIPLARAVNGYATRKMSAPVETESEKN